MFSMLAAEAFKRAVDDSDGDPDEEGAFPFPRVLDLYAGTGALGIEALSRGAERCDFIESNARARAAIEENLRRTELARKAAVHAMRAEKAVSTFGAPYALILADPPYADPTLPELLADIGASGTINARTLVMIEHARSVELPTAPGRLHLLRSRYHGTTAITLYASGASDVGQPFNPE
jgi:16S rRNA (guanine966-N2)-methyltransferase